MKVIDKTKLALGGTPAQFDRALQRHHVWPLTLDVAHFSIYQIWSVQPSAMHNIWRVALSSNRTFSFCDIAVLDIAAGSSMAVH